MEGRKEDSGRQGRQGANGSQAGSIREGRQGANEGTEDQRGCRIYGEPAKSDHPPPFAERQVPSTLIIFRTKKVEKSSPQRTG